MNSNELFLSLPEPVTEEARRLRSLVSPKRWRTIVEDLLEKARIVREVFYLHEQAGEQRLPSLKKVAPEVGWSCFEHWRRRWQSGEGTDWERLLDRRIPPRPEKTPSDVSAAAVALRRADPRMNCEKARKHLVEQFGEKGELSDTTMHRLSPSCPITFLTLSSTIPPGGRNSRSLDPVSSSITEEHSSRSSLMAAVSHRRKSR